MPARNSVKQYLENGYYHIYNRGVEKRLIFLDEQDYSVFLSYLKEYLLPKSESELRKQLTDPKTSYQEKYKILAKLRLNNFSEEITLLAYCLMPNHFHFFIKQKNAFSIDKFMQSISTRYIMYFNRKYKRVGSLFQAVYKAVLVTTEPQFIYLSKYIHKQALYNQPNSYYEYIQKRQTEWVKPNEVLSYFSKSNSNLSYENYVLEPDKPNLSFSKITLED